ncbi:MAG: hypothetical protein U0Z53_29625 [Blastocatellia bacterium]
MILRLFGNATLGVMLILMLLISSIKAQSGATLQGAQTKANPVVGEETYNRVLDILFSRDVPASRGSLWTFILRFKPSSKPESQIIIRRDVNRKLEVVEYTSPDGSIYGKLNEALAHGGKEDAAEMAKSIRVTRREVSVAQAQARRWYATFFDSLASTTKALRERLEESDKTGAESFVLHGTFYDLWYEQGLNEMSFKLYDVEVDKLGSDGEFKLVQWMNAVRREVGKLK